MNENTERIKKTAAAIPRRRGVFAEAALRRAVDDPPRAAVLCAFVPCAGVLRAGVPRVAAPCVAAPCVDVPRVAAPLPFVVALFAVELLFADGERFPPVVDAISPSQTTLRSARLMAGVRFAALLLLSFPKPARAAGSRPSGPVCGHGSRATGDGRPYNSSTSIVIV